MKIENPSHVGRKTITLPRYDVMQQRLFKVETDPYLQEKLMPHLLESAEIEIVPSDVVPTLNAAICQFTKVFDEPLKSAMNSLVLPKRSKYLAAMIVDSDALREAQKILKESTSDEMWASDSETTSDKTWTSDSE